MLKAIPNSDHLSRMYFELSKYGFTSVGEKKNWPYDIKDFHELLALAADMSRFDPRLFSILVSFFYDNWKKINPYSLRMHYYEMKTPQTFAVIAEFILSTHTQDHEQMFFMEYLQKGLKPVPLQLFFHNLYTISGNMMRKAIEMPLREYKRWGFMARETPIIVDELTRETIGTVDATSRKNILINLIKEKKVIGLSDYIAKLDGKISRQQALLDIQSFKKIKKVGKGRGAKWKLMA